METLDHTRDFFRLLDQDWDHKIRFIRVVLGFSS